MTDETIIKDVHDIKNRFTSLGQRVELIYNCLVGNELSKDGGMVADLIDVKAQIKLNEKRIEAIEAKENKKWIYITIIWIAIGTFVGMAVDHFFNK